MPHYGLVSTQQENASLWSAPLQYVLEHLVTELLTLEGTSGDNQEQPIA